MLDYLAQTLYRRRNSVFPLPQLDVPCCVHSHERPVPSLMETEENWMTSEGDRYELARGIGESQGEKRGGERGGTTVISL